MKHIVIDARIRNSSTGRYMDRLLEWLQRTGSHNYRYTIVLKEGDDWKPSSQNFGVIHTKTKPYSFNPLDQITFSYFLHKLKADLVHFTITPQEPIFYFGKRVTTTHDLTMFRFARAGKLPEIAHQIRMMGYKFLFWHSHRVSKKIIVPTEFVKKDLINLHSFAKDKVVVTLEASEPPIKEKSKKLDSVKDKFIMHVGSPLPHKNIERLIDAFGIIKKDHPDLKLVLAGKKEFFFNKLIKEKIEGNQFESDIITPGFIEDSELKWLYENAECYVLPSLSEGFGLPGLEAMAHGTPLASSNETCMPEVYGDAAIYFNPLDIQSITDVVGQVLTEKDLANKLQTLGYKRVSCFSWEKMAKETLSVYEDVLKI